MGKNNEQRRDGLYSTPLELVWKCLSCGHLWERCQGIPEKCENCGAEKTEFAILDED